MYRSFRSSSQWMHSCLSCLENASILAALLWLVPSFTPFFFTFFIGTAISVLFCIKSVHEDSLLQPGLGTIFILQLVLYDNHCSILFHPHQFCSSCMQPLDVQPLLEAGLLSSLVIVLYRLLYSADSASSVLAADTLGITRVPDGSEEENRRVLVRL